MKSKIGLQKVLCAASVGFLAISSQSYAATATICTGDGNEFQDELCDYTEINAAIGTSFLSNADIPLLAKDDAPDDDGPGDGKAGLEVTDSWSSDDWTITFTLDPGLTPKIIVEKYDGLYDVYDFAEMTFLGNDTYSFMRPDHSDLPCAAIGVTGSDQCNPTAETSHVSAYVPIPAAAWLFGSGLIGLAGIARKRKAS